MSFSNKFGGVPKDTIVLANNIANGTVDFKDVDGVCNCPYTSKGDIPTKAELKTAIEAVLGDIT